MKKSVWLPAGLAAATWAVGRIVRQRNWIDFRNRSVVITGGSRGLGLELADQLTREGATVSLLARDAAELNRAASKLADRPGLVRVYPCDLRNNEEIKQVFGQILNAEKKIDILINNAGVIQVSPLENLEESDFDEAMNVHFQAPLTCIRSVVPGMKSRNFGRIVNISSIGGLVAIPHLIPYSASKFALTGLSDGLRSALSRHNIHVTTVCPGLMRTGSHVNALFKGRHRKEFGWFSIANANPMLSVSAERAARQIVDALRFGDPFLAITLPTRLAYILQATCPSLTANLLNLTERLLPGPADPGDKRAHEGRNSTSSESPSILTGPADRVVEAMNENPGPGSTARND